MVRSLQIGAFQQRRIGRKDRNDLVEQRIHDKKGSPMWHESFRRSIQRALVGSLVGFLLWTGLNTAHAVTIRPGFDANTLSSNDDGSAGPVSIGFTVNFFGSLHSSLFVNNNGNVTFDSPLAAFTPFDLTSTARQIIAPFFADVDTRGPGDPVTYGMGMVDGSSAFGVNWVNVAHYSEAGPLNSFQLVLIDRSDTGAGNFDIEFNYNQILWEAGEASGSNPNGLGGDAARVGYSNGTGAPGTFFELPGSAINGAFLDSNLATGLIHNRLNSDVNGRYIFAARDSSIHPGSTDPVPEPGTWMLMGTGVIGMLGYGWRKRKMVG
jgi:hypothetical protein